MKLVSIIIVAIGIIVFIGIFMSKNKSKELVTTPVSGLKVRDVNPNKVRAILLKQAVLNDDIEEIKKILGSVKYSAAGVWEEAKDIGLQSSQINPEVAKLFIEAGVDPKNLKSDN